MSQCAYCKIKTAVVLPYSPITLNHVWDNINGSSKNRVCVLTIYGVLKNVIIVIKYKIKNKKNYWFVPD